MSFKRNTTMNLKEQARPICDDPPARCGGCRRPIRDVFYRVAEADLCPPCALSGPALKAYEKWVMAPFSTVFRKVEG